MHKKRASEDPLRDKVTTWKKKNIIVGPLKIPKSLINPVSKSEKSSPATIRTARKFECTSGQSSKHSSPKVTQNNFQVNCLKLSNISKVDKLRKHKQENSVILIRQSPTRSSPKVSFLKRKNSDSALSKSTTDFQMKSQLNKERETLIEYITKSFTKSLVEPPTDDRFYTISGLLGQGAFGKVMLGHHILTGKKVAIKAIDKAHLQNEHAKRKIFREVYILKKLKSNYVVKILEVFETEKNFLIVMENMLGGDLLKYMKLNGKIPEDRCKKLFFQIVLGISTVHKQGILHRDVKLDNILLDKTLQSIKICDFGVSKLIHKGEIILDQCGTPAYLAPEIVLDKGYEGFWSDIWSLGVLLYCMVCGTVPFKANTLQDLHKAILLGRYDLPEFLSLPVRDLLKRMLLIVPSKRIPLDQILIHSWFEDLSQTYQEASLEEETLRLNQEVMQSLESFGYPRQFVMNSLEYKSLNHAYATYQLLNNK